MCRVFAWRSAHIGIMLASYLCNMLQCFLEWVCKMIRHVKVFQPEINDIISSDTNSGLLFDTRTDASVTSAKTLVPGHVIRDASPTRKI
jgi:hypothetical protein